MSEENLIDPIIKSAEKLGGLTPAAIFAFMWLVQYVKELRKESSDRSLRKKDLERRDAMILSEERQTEAIRAMAQGQIMLRDAYNVTTNQLQKVITILDERLPHK